uniref:Uncharacterized protein n=1 Tax=Arundo donax TaxID=35708 RepID=A0A0A9CK90_ARUDO
MQLSIIFSTTRKCENLNTKIPLSASHQ